MRTTTSWEAPAPQRRACSRLPNTSRQKTALKAAKLDQLRSGPERSGSHFRSELGTFARVCAFLDFGLGGQDARTTGSIDHHRGPAGVATPPELSGAGDVAGAGDRRGRC